jgi:hypothetical protein
VHELDEVVLLQETDEFRIPLVGRRVQGRGQEILAAVVLDLGAVRVVAVAGVVRAVQEQQGAEPVTEPVEGGAVLDQVLVALEVVGPDVLDLVGSLLVEVLTDPVGLAASGLGEGGEPGEQVVDLAPVVRAEREGRDIGKIALVGGQFGVEQAGDRFQVAGVAQLGDQVADDGVEFGGMRGVPGDDPVDVEQVEVVGDAPGLGPDLRG